jgi:hypothetical protein
MSRKAGYYVFTRLPNCKTKVHGGPFKSRKDALKAIFDGMKIVRIAIIAVEIEYWSAADIKRRESVLNFPKEQPAP